MGNFTLLFGSLFMGWLFRRWNLFSKEAAPHFNRFVVSVSLPALILRELHKINFSTVELWIPLMPWLQLVVATILFVVLSKHLKLSKSILGALILMAGLGNTSFVGFPILEWLYGPQAIATGIVVDQGGSFLAAATLGVLLAQYFSGKNLELTSSIKNILKFPPFLAVLASIPLHGLVFPSAVDFTLERLSHTLVPLALFSVGLQMDLSKKVLMQERWHLALALGYKLVLSPLLFVVLYRYVFGIQSEYLEYVLAEAAMAPMITAGVIAIQHGLNAQTVNTILALGIPMSLITVPIWKYLFSLMLN